MVTDKLKGFAYVAIAGMLSGIIIFSGKIFSNMGVSLIELSIFPYVFSLIFLLPFILQKNAFPKKRDFPLLLVYGGAAALTIFCQYAGIILGATVATVVLLLYTQPLWTTAISYFILKEKVTKYQIIACALVFLGVIFLVDPAGLFQSSQLFGIIAALFGGIGLSLWIICGSLASKKGINRLSILYFETLFLVIIILLAYPLVSLFSSAPEIVNLRFDWPIAMWGVFIAYNIFVYTANNLFYYAGSKRISTVNAGIIMLLEPVVGVLLSVLFLSQPLTLGVIIGGACILLGNFIVVTKG